MDISREEVLHIASLSHLKLSEAEIDRLRRDLSSVLTYINTLNRADTSGAPAAEHVFAVPQRLREDKARASFDREAMLKNVPQQSDGFIRVPKVIDG
jgi:aspartyl-tRNA(Asn)/glutamyl-tRNA(Gln) amidotransferase subunit C